MNVDSERAAVFRCARSPSSHVMRRALLLALIASMAVLPSTASMTASGSGPPCDKASLAEGEQALARMPGTSRPPQQRAFLVRNASSCASGLGVGRPAGATTAGHSRAALAVRPDFVPRI